METGQARRNATLRSEPHRNVVIDQRGVIGGCSVPVLADVPGAWPNEPVSRHAFERRPYERVPTARARNDRLSEYASKVSEPFHVNPSMFQ